MNSVSEGSIKLTEIELDYILIRIPRRKSIRLKLLNNKKIEIRCAKSIKWSVINDFVNRKEFWIVNRLEKLDESIQLQFPTHFDEFSEILYMGKYIPVNITYKKIRKYQLKIQNNTLSIHAPLDAKQCNITKKIEIFYKKKLFDLIQQWVSRLESNYKPNIIKVRTYKSKWGSTTNNRQISLNIYLLMLPMHLIKYVFFHEISHLQEMNHSKKYKEILGAFLPEFKSYQEEIKKYRLLK